MMSEATVKSTISVDANAVKKTPAARNDKQLPDIDFDRFKTSRSFAASRKRKDVFMKSLICLAFIIACIPLISVLWTTVANGIKRLNLNFLSYNMSGVVGGSQTPSGGYGGVLHAIIGTLEITLGAMVISVPVGLMCAVYLIEYAARGNKLAKSIGLLVDVMSGIPSIVAGLFAYSMFKQRTICKIVLRTALPGIVSGVILAIARVIGETAPLLMTAGYATFTNVNLFSGEMTTLPVFVYQEYSKLRANCPPNAGSSCVTTIPMERSWAAALVLIIIVLILNLIGRVVARVFAVKSER